MTLEFAADRLDVRGFAEAGGHLSGDVPLADLKRLVHDTRSDAVQAPISWTAEGTLRNVGHINPQVWLHLQARADVWLTCQRCLGPVETPLRVDRHFRFVNDESTAEQEDEDAQEDILVISRNFDLTGLMEDELLMEVPVAPFHEVCPHAVRMAVADEDFDSEEPARANPFAELKNLKMGKR